MAASDRIAGVGLDDLFRDDKGGLWRVQGIATSPTVTLQRVYPFELMVSARHVVIGSPEFNTLQQLVPKGEVDGAC